MTPSESCIPAFNIAFQPIVDIATGKIYSQEAFVRGENGESPQALFLSMPHDLLPKADAAFRQEAIRLAGAQGLTSLINLNVMPSALERSADILLATLETARQCGVKAEQLLLEITESEIIIDIESFAENIDELRQAGLKFAIDDFGAGYAGLNLLADFQPDVVKLDKQLVRGIESRGPRQAIVRGIARTCTDLGIEIIAEGIETEYEFDWFFGEGITLFQGYLLARPSLGHLSSTFFLPQSASGQPHRP